nr:AMP-binding protein [Microbulbifer sp. Q7]
MGTRLVNQINQSIASVSARKDFLVCDGRKLTYGKLFENVGKTRSLLRKRELSIGDRVAIVSADRESVATIYLSCLMEGMTAVVIDPEASAAELNYLLEKSQSRLVFLDRPTFELAGKIQSPESQAVTIPINQPSKKSFFGLRIGSKRTSDDGRCFPECLESEVVISDVRKFPDETLALILFTSGTTSKPKGVQLSHANLNAQIETMRIQFGLSGDSRVLNHLPLHHTDGLNQGPLLACAIGYTWLTPKSVEMQTLGGVLDTIFRERASHLITVPTVLAMIERMPPEYDDSFSSDEFLFIESTAGPLDSDLWRRFEARFGARIVNCYGLTETVCEATYCGPDDGSRKVGTIGKAVGCEVQIFDDSGQEVPSGVSGELCVRGDIVMSGYFNDTDATNAVFRDGWLRTGDLAVKDAEGFVSIVGRLKNVVIRAGINVIPEEVSEVVRRYPGVAAAETIGMPDQLLGERVITCVIAREGTLSTNALFDYCRTSLAREKVPNQILLLNELPYGPSGKVDLPALKNRVRQEVSGVDCGSRSEGKDLAIRVLNTAASVFHVSASTLSMNSSPENLAAWDSLAFLELVMEVEQEFNIVIEAREVVGISCLGDLITLLSLRMQQEELVSDEY